MKYRTIGKTGVDASILGFGCMRFPTVGDGVIDEEKSLEMIDYAIGKGVNYFDTAWPYHKEQSETFLGKALQGKRDKLILVSKSPVWLIEKPDDFSRILDTQLERLQTDHLDFYLLHGLHKERWEECKKHNLIAEAEKARAAGKIRHLSFSFHGKPDAFTEIVDGYDDWAFAMIQYNYMNEEIQAGTKGLAYAASKGLGVIVMEGLLGGQLAQPNEKISQIWSEAGKNPVETAFRWLWDKKEVSVVLSGMSSLEQTKANIEVASLADENCLSLDERKLVEKVRDTYLSYRSIPCTKCNYCMPCPTGVDIPRNFDIYNQSVLHEKLMPSKLSYNYTLADPEKARACIACGQCEPQCPQSIEIMEWMKKIDQALTFAPGEG